jgi:anti-sigma B factor antagonist
MNDLSISAASAEGTTTLAVAGELDPGTAPMLDEAIGAAVAADGVTQVVIDLAGVAFIDSSGLSALVTGSARGEEAGVRVVVTNPSSHCERLLVATNLTHLLGGNDR